MPKNNKDLVDRFIDAVFRSIMGNRQQKMEELLKTDPKLQQLYKDIDNASSEMTKHLDDMLKYSRAKE